METLSVSKSLQEAGVGTVHAEAIAMAIEPSQSDLVTKDRLRTELAPLFVKLLLAGIGIAGVHLAIAGVHLAVLKLFWKSEPLI